MTVVAAEGLAEAGGDVFAAGGEASSTESLASRNRTTSRAANSRRAAVLGPGQGSGRQSQGPGQSSRGSKRSSGGSSRKSRGKSKGLSFDSLAGKTNGGPLLAEYIGGVVIIFLGTLILGGSKGYVQAMGQLMLRLTALTTVFFVLFLMSGTKGGKAAVWFGLLVDLGILFTAASQGATTQLIAVIQGVPTGGDVLTASADVAEPPPLATLPSDQPATGPVTA